MTENKYAKYITTPMISGDKNVNWVEFAGKSVGGANFTMWWYSITQPFHMEEPPHTHSHDQFVLHFGSNPYDMTEFNAVIEMSLGEEGEINIIDKPSILYLPAGFIHRGPNFKRVGSPITIVNIFLVSEYAKLKTYEK
jgi:hypothetical protein